MCYGTASSIDPKTPVSFHPAISAGSYHSIQCILSATENCLCSNVHFGNVYHPDSS